MYRGHASITEGEKPAERHNIGSYRHLQPFPKDNLYHRVRRLRGLSQRQMADAFGVSWSAWKYRERVKRMYHVSEVLALMEASELGPTAFINLLKDIA